jgi:phosphatidylserine/phosphatidylglycerophosphate/cardiolipin synthase-like enzyme
MSGDPYLALGEFLTSTEALRISKALESEGLLSQALKEVNAERRGAARALLASAELGQGNVAEAVKVLRSIAGARSVRTVIDPVWTMPGNAGGNGRLTSEVQRLIRHARSSVVCSTYNFQDTSYMWEALREVAQTPAVSVTVYVDAEAGSAVEVAAQLPGAAVFRTRSLPGYGKAVKNHAKYIVIDSRMVLLTSANFSFSAENLNIELGLLVEDTALAESIEKQILDCRELLYERVGAYN